MDGATKLVTLTGGGNDVGWAPRILLSGLPRPVRAIPSVRRQLESFADPDLTEQRFGNAPGEPGDDRGAGTAAARRTARWSPRTT